MRVVHVINSLATGGAETVVVDFAIEAARVGDDVTILTLSDDDGIPLRRAKAAGIRVINLSSSVWNPFIPFRIMANSKNAEIVHAHLFPAFYWVALLPGRRLVFTEHSTNNRRMSFQWLRPLELLVYSRYSKLIAITDGVARRLKDHVGPKLSSRVVVSTNGIRETFFERSSARKSHNSRIVSVGSLKPVKRHALAIQAVAQLESATLKIAGEGPMRSELTKLIDSLGVSDRIELLGAVDDIPSLLQESDVLLCCSEFEGFSLAAAEAQAAGLPVVGPAVDGLDEVVVDGMTGFLFEGAEVSGVVTQLRRAMSEENYPRLSRQAVEHAGHFSIRSSYGRQLEVYEEALKLS